MPITDARIRFDLDFGGQGARDYSRITDHTRQRAFFRRYWRLLGHEYASLVEHSAKFNGVTLNESGASGHASLDDVLAKVALALDEYNAAQDRIRLRLPREWSEDLLQANETYACIRYGYLPNGTWGPIYNFEVRAGTQDGAPASDRSLEPDTPREVKLIATVTHSVSYAPEVQALIRGAVDQIQAGVDVPLDGTSLGNGATYLWTESVAGSLSATNVPRPTFNQAALGPVDLDLTVTVNGVASVANQVTITVVP